MSFYPSDTDIFAQALPQDIPELRYLCYAVELGSEGETQLLLGPLPGHQGPYFAIRNDTTYDEETGGIHIVGTHLENVGGELLPALERLNPYWKALTLVYVAPHLRAQLPYSPKESEGARPLVCTAVYRRCPWWPDGSRQDAYWLQGNLDQVSAVMGQLMPEHQQQLLRHGDQAPYSVLVSADGLQRYAMPEHWPSEPFKRLEPVPITDLSLIPETVMPVLALEPVLRRYRALKSESKLDLHLPLEAVSKLTWPLMIVASPKEDGPVIYTVCFVHGQGMEEDYWDIEGQGGDEQAVRLSVLLRNVYRFGVLAGQKYGECESLNYAVAGVRRSNS